MALALEASSSSASLASVSAWLESVASESLTTRADKVSRFERNSGVHSDVSELRAMVDDLAAGGMPAPPPDSSHSATTPPPTASLPEPPKEKRRGLRALLSVLVLGAAAGAAVWYTMPEKLAFLGIKPLVSKPPSAAAESTPEPAPTAVHRDESPAPAVSAAADSTEASAAPPEASAASSASAKPADTAPQPAPAVRRPVKRSSSGKHASPFKDLGGRQ
jgi:hypothetical protein